MRTLAVRGRLYDAARSRKCSVGRNGTTSAEGDMSVDGKTAAPRVLKLIDFLSDYDAQRHPPVHDINDERLYRLDEQQLPDVPGVALTPGANTWLSVDFVNLPPRPEPPDDIAAAIRRPIRASAPPDLLLVAAESADDEEMAQARMINTMLIERLGPQSFLQRRVKVGESADFQGDERDVVVISTVVGTDPNRPEGKPRPLTGRGDMRRINVAASRAQQQMWVVYSIDPENLSAQDLRAELIRHCRDPRGFDHARDSALEAIESPFEEQVLTHILGRGYRRVFAQYEVGSAARNYRIDLVVAGPTTRLAVECDGERWHGPERWHADHARQQVLERAGWTFERIRGSEFYRDPDRALEPLWSRLEALGIPTGDEWLSGDGAQPSVREVYGGPNPDVADDDEAEPFADKPEGLPVPHARTVIEDAADSSVTPPLSTSSAPTWSSTIGPTPRGERISLSFLKPHISWIPRPVEDPVTARPFLVGEVLSEIVAAEGPMYALRAYQLYVKAAGAHRVGRDLRFRLDRALRLAVADGGVMRSQDAIEDYAGSTLYAPGSAPVVMRQLGPRQLNDVPRSEVQMLIHELDAADLDEETRTRAVLDAYGLIRLTERAREYVTECVAYRWTSGG
jgi:very-short-patch-repair endonuclease